MALLRKHYEKSPYKPKITQSRTPLHPVHIQQNSVIEPTTSSTTITNSVPSASTSPFTKEQSHEQSIGLEVKVEQLPRPNSTCITATVPADLASATAPAASPNAVSDQPTNTSSQGTGDRSMVETLEGCARGCGSPTKRRLKLAEETSCASKPKRRRTLSRNDSSGSGKKLKGQSGTLCLENTKDARQRTVQSYFKNSNV